MNLESKKKEVTVGVDVGNEVKVYLNLSPEPLININSGNCIL